MILVMRYQGRLLITPVSPSGILDLEFARTNDQLNRLKLFWDLNVVRINIYLDFLFIAAYTWFLVSVCNRIKKSTGGVQWPQMISGMAVTAGLFDVCENFLMLLVLNARFDSWLMQIVFYCALIKFILIALVLIYLAITFVVIRIKRNSTNLFL